MPDQRPAQAPDPRESASWTHYRALVEQSNAARAAGKHVEAQRLASAAHRWSIDEFARLQRLEQALTALSEAQAQLETAWDKDRSCATLVELAERHPEFQRLINACAAAQERVDTFLVVQPVEAAAAEPPSPRRTTRVTRSHEQST